MSTPKITVSYLDGNVVITVDQPTEIHLGEGMAGYGSRQSHCVIAPGSTFSVVKHP